MVQRSWYKINDKSKYVKKVVASTTDEKKEPVFHTNDSLEDGIARALRQRTETKTFCEHCNSRNISYQGLGIYLCEDCKMETKTNYGKVREFLDRVGSCNANELILGTGLTKADIDSLVKAGSIEYKRDGMIRVMK